jgi:L-malate glycosyltransferase
MKNKPKRILVLCPSPPGTAPTQRLKYEQYFSLLEKKGYSFTISAFQTQRCWKIVYKTGYRYVLEKIFWYFLGYVKRFLDLFRAPFYDAVFVNLWGTPLGKPYYEHLLLLMNDNLIYDIDDMVYMKEFEHAKQNFFQRLKGSKKPLTLMKYARYVITCTPKLEEVALSLNKYGNVIDISSTLDTEIFTPIQLYKQNDPVTLGWTGTHSTLSYLELLQPILSEVSRQRNIRLLVIANRKYSMKDVPTEYIEWNKQSEVQDLHRIEIGLYPVLPSEWALGKSSLKALTYMAVGIPFVATAFGTNFRIMKDGEEGFLAKDKDEWVQRIIQLIDDAELRKRMGQAGRKTLETSFSIKANFQKYLSIFDTVSSRQNENKLPSLKPHLQ